MWSDPDIVELILEENDGKRNNMLQNPNLPSALKNCAVIKLWCFKTRASHFSPVSLTFSPVYCVLFLSNDQDSDQTVAGKKQNR